MNIASLVFNLVGENTYIIWDATGECAIIDAGNSREDENKILEQFIESKGLKPVLAINTHGHFDHAMGVEFVRRRWGVPFAMSSDDQYLLDATPTGSVVYGIKIGEMPSKIDIDLKSLDEVTFGETTLQVIKTPGHTPGHVSLYEPKSKSLITGDTLFRESIGRTDLPGGDYAVLMSSIIERIIPLGDEVSIYPGHCESSTIGHETLYNPFIVEVINEEIKYK
ncbi:MAG: MBL fold metallo-hydrolase [Rikenellaceae bacterium]